jgi:hypothetical protein
MLNSSEFEDEQRRNAEHRRVIITSKISSYFKT